MASSIATLWRKILLKSFCVRLKWAGSEFVIHNRAIKQPILHFLRRFCEGYWSIVAGTKLIHIHAILYDTWSKTHTLFQTPLFDPRLWDPTKYSQNIFISSKTIYFGHLGNDVTYKQKGMAKSTFLVYIRKCYLGQWASWQVDLLGDRFQYDRYMQRQGPAQQSDTATGKQASTIRRKFKPYNGTIIYLREGIIY